MKRLVGALLCLPLVVVILMALYSAASAEPGAAIQAVSNLGYQALWYCLVAYMSIGVLAMPILFVALKKNLLAWWHAATAGALVGALTFLPVYLPTLFDDKLHWQYRIDQLANLHEGALIGGVHGMLFWLLALWRNRSFADAKRPVRSAV